MHIKLHTLRKRVRNIALGLATTSLAFSNVALVSAANLDTASLALSDGRPSETGITYTFDASGFTTGTNVGCIDVQLNDAADGTGSIPSGITTTSSTLDSSTLITAGSWTVDNGSNGRLRITNGTTEAPAASGNVVWGGITNGDTEGTTYFGIVSTYTDSGCTPANLVDEVTVAFVYKAGEPVELTVDPTLSFVCVAVAASQAVNGATTTHASTATGIDFDNDVTSSTNGVSAHDLQVTTNAAGGYVIYARHTQQLTNANGDTIDNHTGTNAAPTAFSAAGTESWGYTSEDSTLAGGTADRFTTTGGDKWAGFLTTNEEVASNTAAVPGTETTRVGHQAGIASTTEAGTYETEIVYTIVATY